MITKVKFSTIVCVYPLTKVQLGISSKWIIFVGETRTFAWKSQHGKSEGDVGKGYVYIYTTYLCVRSTYGLCVYCVLNESKCITECMYVIPDICDTKKANLQRSTLLWQW